MRSVLGVLVATGALAVVPGDVQLYDSAGQSGPSHSPHRVLA